MAANFGPFLLSQIFRQRCPQKVVPALLPPPSAHHVVMFRGTTSHSAKVIVAHTPHFKPIFALPLFLQKVLGNPVPGGGCTGKLSHSLARGKISGRSALQEPKYNLPKKSIW